MRSNRDDFEKQLGIFVAIAISRIPPSPPMAKRSWADTTEKGCLFKQTRRDGNTTGVSCDGSILLADFVSRCDELQRTCNIRAVIEGSVQRHHPCVESGDAGRQCG